MLERLKALAATAAERAIKTFAQTLAAMLTASGTGLLDTDWLTSLSVAGMAAFLSLLTTVGGEYVPAKRGEDGAWNLSPVVTILFAVFLVVAIFWLLGHPVRIG